MYKFNAILEDQMQNNTTNQYAKYYALPSKFTIKQCLLSLRAQNTSKFKDKRAEGQTVNGRNNSYSEILNISLICVCEHTAQLHVPWMQCGEQIQCPAQVDIHGIVRVYES